MGSLRDRDSACNVNNVRNSAIPANSQKLNISYSRATNTGFFTELGLDCAPFATANGNIANCNVDWHGFERWLLRKELSREYVRRLVAYAQKYCHCFFSGRLSAVEFSGSKHMTLSALSQLSKFLGCYGHFKRLKEESGLTWHDFDNGSVFSRIYCEEAHGVLDWLRECQEKVEYAEWFPLKWIFASGLRTSEAYNSLEIIRNEGLGGYLNKELGVLEHFRYPKVFLRRSKKAYITVLNDDILEELESYRVRARYHKLKKKLRKLGMRVRTYDLRKAWASFMVMNSVPESVVDLVQGRVGKNVFQVSYFRPNMLQVCTSVRTALKKYRAKLEI